MLPVPNGARSTRLGWLALKTQVLQRHIYDQLRWFASCNPFPILLLLLSLSLVFFWFTSAVHFASRQYLLAHHHHHSFATATHSSFGKFQVSHRVCRSLSLVRLDTPASARLVRSTPSSRCASFALTVPATTSSVDGACLHGNLQHQASAEWQQHERKDPQNVGKKFKAAFRVFFPPLCFVVGPSQSLAVRQSWSTTNRRRFLASQLAS